MFAGNCLKTRVGAGSEISATLLESNIPERKKATSYINLKACFLRTKSLYKKLEMRVLKL